MVQLPIPLPQSQISYPVLGEALEEQGKGKLMELIELPL